ncbi:MAG: DUF721 domain-containing protein [Vampirovibrio sp.]|nr:DUF721 domain-containing protein [Vampirovibrio sp.]
MKRRRPKSTFVPVADVLGAVTEDLKLDQRVQEFALLNLWPQLVGEPYAGCSKASRISRRGNETVLTVKVSDSAMASQMGFLLPTVQTKLNSYKAQTGIQVDKINVQVGKI